ncbi:MAG: hypothetical protein HQK51_04020 [Oligoflexia bacterium]|nr:hypothetical protein [Oligoflexia bacterium]
MISIISSVRFFIACILIAFILTNELTFANNNSSAECNKNLPPNKKDELLDKINDNPDIKNTINQDMLLTQKYLGYILGIMQTVLGVTYSRLYVRHKTDCKVTSQKIISFGGYVQLFEDVSETIAMKAQEYIINKKLNSLTTDDDVSTDFQVKAFDSVIENTELIRDLLIARLAAYSVAGTLYVVGFGWALYELYNFTDSQICPLPDIRTKVIVGEQGKGDGVIRQASERKLNLPK